MVRIREKLCPLSWKSGTVFSHPDLGTFAKPWAQFFLIQTSQPVNNIYVCVLICSVGSGFLKLPSNRPVEKHAIYMAKNA
jgi:hypothetical protein